MLDKKPIPVIVYIPSARCGQTAVFETANFARSVEHKLGVKVVKIERQLAYDLNPEISEEAAEEFCLDQLHTFLRTGFEDDCF